MRSFKRSQRVADQIKRDASQVIENMLQDRPGLLVTVSVVQVSDDLRYAKILYTVLGGDDKRKEAERFFERATGYIQGELARRLRLRRMPEITIKYDKSLVEGMRMVSLIEEVMENTEKKDDSED